MPPYYPPMLSRILTTLPAFTYCAIVSAAPAFADGLGSPIPRPLGTGGAMRAVATGDAGPQLNPSGISIFRAYSVEGSYQYGSTAGSQDARISAVDSTSSYNIGGAVYYSYHRDSPGDGKTQTGHLVGGSLSFPLLDKIFLGGNLKYIHFDDAQGKIHSGLTFDAGLTIRPIPLLSIGVVGYNLLDHGIQWSPKALGGGIAILPMPSLIFVFDSVMEKVYSDLSRDSAMHYMGGVELSISSAAAIRLGGGHDGLSKNGYVSAGVSAISADVGAIDVGLRQDVSGNSKSTIIGISARLFIPAM